MTGETKVRGSDWVVWHRQGNAAAIRLFAFAFAGGGASVFRQWAKLLPNHVDLAAIQLPGRENRIIEPPLTSIASVVREIALAIEPLIDLPFAFFGHSLGSLLAFETARCLRRSNAPLPAYLFLSGRRAAHLPLNRRPFHDLPDADLVEHVRRMGGTPLNVLADAELMALLMPTIRADFALNDLYRHAPEAPLDIPCSILGGEADATAPGEDLAAWRTITRADAQVTMFPGGHFFVDSSRQEVVRLVADKLDDWLGGASVATAM